VQNPTAQPKLQALCKMGNKRTITNHKTYAICNQTAHNTSDIKTTVLLHRTNYKWLKNSVEDLALMQNQELHETYSRQSSKIQVLEVFLFENQVESVLTVCAHFSLLENHN